MPGASGEVLAAVRSNQSHTSQREAFPLCCVQGGQGQPLGRLGLSTCCAIEDIDGEVQASQAMGVMVVPDMHMGVSGRIRGHFHKVGALNLGPNRVRGVGRKIHPSGHVTSE